MPNKAQFKGHCQWCGSLQKLPGGVLSKHGYTVNYGFFSGICAGASHAPFEQANYLLVQSITSAKASVKSLQDEQFRLRAPVALGTTQCWVHVYVPATWQDRRARYEWREVDLRAEARPNGYVEFLYTVEVHGKASTKRVEMYGSETTTVEDACTFQNRKRAESLTAQVIRLERYIRWQQGRVDNWKPSALLPIDLKADGAAFDVDGQ